METFFFSFFGASHLETVCFSVSDTKAEYCGTLLAALLTATGIVS